MWLNNAETFQAAEPFIIYHKNKDTRLQINLLIRALCDN